MRIFLDIETLPAIDMPDAARAGLARLPKRPEPGLVPSNWKDAAKIAAKQAENEARHTADLAAWIAECDALEDEAWRRTALDPLALRVLCVAFAVDDGPARCLVADDYDQIDADDSEAWLMQALDRELGDATRHGDLPTIIGHNVAGFDLPALLLRAAKYRCTNLLRILPRERYSKRIEDTMQLAAGPNPRPSWMRLDALCRYFGVEGKPDGIDGSKVYDHWLAGNIDAIADYCRHDVETTRDLWRWLSGRAGEVGL